MTKFAEIPQRAAARRARLIELMHDCLGSPETQQGARLREAHALWRAVPVGERPTLPSSGRFETMLASGAYESAALALLGFRSAFMLSRGTSGVCIATLVAPGDCGEITAEAASPALALLAAAAKMMIADKQSGVRRAARHAGLSAPALH